MSPNPTRTLADFAGDPPGSTHPRARERQSPDSKNALSF